MSENSYLKKVSELIARIEESQGEAIQEGARVIAETIAAGRVCHMFGSGHSILPAMDLFPRYGSFVGFHPLVDPRLAWFNVMGPGGAPELLWIERAEGYIENFLKGVDIRSGDAILVYSHGGLNAAPVETAMFARGKGCKVIAVTSMANSQVSKARHSSGNRLCDVADVVIDNCVPPEDSLVKIPNLSEPVAAGSTVAVITISMALVEASARLLVEKGVKLDVFVSPNVQPDTKHNESVYAQYWERIARR